MINVFNRKYFGLAFGNKYFYIRFFRIAFHWHSDKKFLIRNVDTEKHLFISQAAKKWLHQAV